MSQKIGIIFVLILVFTQIASAQNENYDYNSDDSYKNADFYSHSDPTQWDYDKVNWDKVDFSRAELYTSSKFYNNIPDDKYENLDYTRVDYSQIKDHNKIDSAKYFQDMGCSSCSLDRGGQNLKFSKDGITHQQSGDSVTIRNYPAGTRYIGKADRIEVIVPEEINELFIPKEDGLTLNSNGRDIIINGIQVNGELSYRQGEAYLKQEDQAKTYIKAGNEATINDVKISAKESQEDVNIFFDGQRHEGNYVSFGTKEKLDFQTEKKEIEGTSFMASGKDIDLQFLSSNKYLSVNNQREPYYLDQNDYIAFSLKDGALDIEGRSDKNNLPMIKTTGSLVIQNDEDTITIDGKEFSYPADKQTKMLRSSRLFGLIGADKGSVYFELEPGGDEEKHWFVGDNHEIRSHDKDAYEFMAEERQDIKKGYGTNLDGYFSPDELTSFTNDLARLKQGGFDVSTWQPPLTIANIDRRVRGKGWENLASESFVDRYLLNKEMKSSNIVFWTPTYDLSNSKDLSKTEMSTKGKDVNYDPTYDRNLYHEVGHIINNQKSEDNSRLIQIPGTQKYYSGWSPYTSEGDLNLDGSWKQTLETSGISIDESTGQQKAGNTNPSKFTFDMKGNSGKMVNALFSQLINPLSGQVYAKTNLGESQAEVFAMAMTSPDWFTNEARVDDKLAKSAGKTKGEILEIRQSLAKLYGFDFKNK